MKSPTLLTLGLVLVVTFGLAGFTPTGLAEPTATSTLPPVGPVLRTITHTITTTISSSVITATASPAVTATRRPTGTATATWTSTPSPTSTSSATPTFTLVPPTATPWPTSTPSPTVTGVVANPVGSGLSFRYPLAMDPQALALDALRARPYGSGPIKVTRVLSSDEAFMRVLFEYPSDGLRITGMMNIPQGPGPFPVVILDHGYFKPSEYKTGDGSNRAADYFARYGYLTLAPDYRCYGGSQCSSNPLDVGYAIDVMNLIASLPSLSYADPSRIGIWGHSMGGGVTIRVLTISDQIKVAALYGAVAGDDEVHYCWLNGCRMQVSPTRSPRPIKLQEIDPNFAEGLPTPAPAAPDPMAKLKEIFARSSPYRHLNYINAPVIIHHGEADDMVPLQWSLDLAMALANQGKQAYLYFYPGEGHVFVGWNWSLFMARTVAFFNDYLNPRETPITAERRVLRRERGILDLTY